MPAASTPKPARRDADDDSSEKVKAKATLAHLPGPKQVGGPPKVAVPKDLKMPKEEPAKEKPKSGRREEGGSSRPNASHGDGEASGSARVSTSSPAAITPRAKALAEKHSGYARLLQVEEKPVPTRLASPVPGDARSASCFFKAPPCSIPVFCPVTTG